MILQASPVLYVATGDRAYFKGVQILIPQSWKDVNATISSWETFEVRIYGHYLSCFLLSYLV